VRRKIRKFYTAPQWAVIGKYRTALNEPALQGDFEAAKFYAISIAKKGYYGGNYKAILQEDLPLILDILEYENFMGKYEIALHVLNTQDKRNKR
jgi:hypothetical protein